MFVVVNVQGLHIRGQIIPKYLMLLVAIVNGSIFK